MALDLRQNFVSAQYPENNSKEFNQILYLHWYWHDLAWVSYFRIDYFGYFLHICTRVMALDLWQNFVTAQYLENKLTDFIYALILTRSRSGLLHIIFRMFVQIFGQHWSQLRAREYYAWIWSKAVSYAFGREEEGTILGNIEARVVWVHFVKLFFTT